MGLEIVWSKQAAKGYASILKYLDGHWTEKEVVSFEEELVRFLSNLSEHPYLLSESSKKGLRRGPINKLTMLTYRVTAEQLQLVNIRSTRQKPVK